MTTTQTPFMLPWHVRGSAQVGQWHIQDANGHDICHVEPHATVVETEKLVRLLASAGEMRVALERLADRVEQIVLLDGSTPDTLEARTLLAKVDGEELMPITILDVAKARGVKEENGAISGSEFFRVGLQFMGGCARCQASLAAFNAYPSKSGYWKCDECIGDDGFATVDEFEDWDYENLQRIERASGAFDGTLDEAEAAISKPHLFEP